MSVSSYKALPIANLPILMVLFFTCSVTGAPASLTIQSPSTLLRKLGIILCSDTTVNKIFCHPSSLVTTEPPSSSTLFGSNVIPNEINSTLGSGNSMTEASTANGVPAPPHKRERCRIIRRSREVSSSFLEDGRKVVCTAMAEIRSCSGRCYSGGWAAVPLLAENNPIGFNDFFPTQTSGRCCKATRLESTSIALACDNGSTRSLNVQIPEACACGQ